jgi:hypothetical protein
MPDVMPYSLLLHFQAVAFSVTPRLTDYRLTTLPNQGFSNRIVNTSKAPVCSNCNFSRSQSFLRFNAIGLILGRVPLAFTRFIVLSALGAAMVWLFTPSKHKPSLDNNRVQVAAAPVSFRTAQATVVVNEPDSLASQESGTVASIPDQSPSPSPTEQPDVSRKESAILAESSHHRFPASGGSRHRSGNRSRTTFLHSKNRTLFQREIADFKVRLISVWRRSVFSGARHR